MREEIDKWCEWMWGLLDSEPSEHAKRFHKWLEEPKQKKHWSDFYEVTPINEKERAKIFENNMEFLERWKIKQLLKRMKKGR